MIDFTDMPIRKKAYAGANGGKIAVMYEGEQYRATVWKVVERIISGGWFI